MADALNGPRLLSGWKDIANYMGRGVRTVQRYERELGLPVRRPAGKQSLVAISTEIDAWIKDNCVTFAASAAPAKVAPIGTELAQRLASTHRRTATLRESLAAMIAQQHRLRALTSELIAHLRNANAIIQVRQNGNLRSDAQEQSLPLAS